MTVRDPRRVGMSPARRHPRRHMLAHPPNIAPADVVLISTSTPLDDVVHPRGLVKSTDASGHRTGTCSTGRSVGASFTSARLPHPIGSRVSSGSSRRRAKKKTAWLVQPNRPLPSHVGRPVLRTAGDFVERRVAKGRASALKPSSRYFEPQRVGRRAAPSASLCEVGQDDTSLWRESAIVRPAHPPDAMSDASDLSMPILR